MEGWVLKSFITPRHSIADLKNYKSVPEEIQNRLIFPAAIAVSTVQVRKVILSSAGPGPSVQKRGITLY